jgi:hypothetical protein
MRGSLVEPPPKLWHDKSMEALRPEEQEDRETIRIVLERLKTADKEPKGDDSALEEIIRKRKHPVPK